FVGAAQKRRQILGVPNQVVDGLLLLRVVVGRLAGGVVHDHADVGAPEREKRRLGVRAVGQPDRLRDVDRVGIQGGGGSLEFGLAVAKGRAGRAGGEIHVL